MLIAITCGIIGGIVVAVFSRFTKGAIDQVAMSLVLGFLALYLFHYAFDDMKKALAIAAGVFFMRLSLAALPGPAYDYFEKLDTMRRKARSFIADAIRKKE